MADDLQLRGVLEPGTPVDIIMNYYQCNPIERGDLVYFRFHTEQEPVIRIARGIPGDKVDVVKDKRGGWQILINDEPLTIRNGEILHFGGDPTPPLKSAAAQRGNHLGEMELVLLSNSDSGVRDSLTMGMLSLYDVVGKVLPIKGETK